MISFYFDEHIPRRVKQELEKLNLTCVMAVDVGMEGKDDDTEHLVYAAAQGLVVVTRDKPFAGRATSNTEHAGLICWTGRDTDLGGMVRALAAFATKHTATEVAGRVFWIKDQA
jgi:hypothetical protein